jgi:tetratricopeptide (TPR) repeat protein
VRDKFPPHIIKDLANRAGNCCSNPECRRPTSGPTAKKRGAINIGVGAHITAASRGGPRYDPKLTSAQRVSIKNGIWLCQTCSRLIDVDQAKYTKEVLRAWKGEAELRAKSLIELPELPTGKNEPALSIPETNPKVSSLAFSARFTKFLGRKNEKDALGLFFGAKENFLWWLVTGPGGTGKSRLALELCREKRAEWYAGFLSKTEQFKDWSRFRPTRPTLIVMDYVANRAEDVGQILLQLSRASQQFPFPVRVLLLERDKGSWWSEAVRESSQSERAEISAHLFYSKPLPLKGLALKELIALAQGIFKTLGAPWTPAHEREFKRRMETLDALGRPLFAMMATIFLGFPGANSNVSGHLLDQVLEKEAGRRHALAQGSANFQTLENLIFLATLVGGLLPKEGGFQFLKKSPANALLPEVALLDLKLYCELTSAPSTETSLAGLQPDILGERLVLNRIATLHALDQSVSKLLVLAWEVQPLGLSDFIVRTTSDFPDDPALAKLCDLPLGSKEKRFHWGRLVAELVRVTGTSKSVFTQSLIAKLRKLSDSFPKERDLSTECARAELNLGNIFIFNEDNAKAALAQFEATMVRGGAGSDMEASAINNRGIVHNQMKDSDLAFKDWSLVIKNKKASDEARACSFNNRADIYVKRGEHKKAIADRSSVLALKKTSSDRRYIALTRRSRSFLATKQTAKAISDLDTLLAMDDIPSVQKAEGLLQRGKINAGLKSYDKARQDYGEVLATDSLFRGATESALIGLAQLSHTEGDPDRAMQYLHDALTSGEARGDDYMEGLILTATLLEKAGEKKEALKVWQRILKNPRTSVEQRTAAKNRISHCK